MGRVEKSVTLNVPAEDCYRIWTDFEDYPRFLANLKKVTRRDHSNIYHWLLELGPEKEQREWDIEVDLMEPNRIVSWRTLEESYPPHAVVVLLHDLGDNTTRVEMILTYPGTTLDEVNDDMVNSPQRMMERDLAAFVHLAESRMPYSRRVCK